MSKQDTKFLKGLAILLMLFLHLFNHEDNYFSFCYIGDASLVSILSRACSPVSFFLILGGIGLYSVWKSGKGNIIDNFKRIFRLYVHYWIILIIFVSIGFIVNCEKYPGSLKIIASNFTAFNTTYNGECWFLFPYSLLALSAPFLFKLLEKYGMKIVIVAFVIGVITSFMISRYGHNYLFGNMLLYNPLLYFHLLFPFLLGASIVKYNYGDIVKTKVKNILLIWFLIIGLVIITCSINTSVFYSIYALVLILCVKALPKWNWVNKVFCLLGEHSMNMWLIHTWFAYYLFHDIVYGLKYPILILIGLILMSIITSFIVNFISKPIVQLVKKN